ncbi:hypothetical protein MBLNU13_g09692t1 [Cladosporium sp. NU13]
MAGTDLAHLEPLLDSYEYAHNHSRPEVDHKCANACLDAMINILDEELDGLIKTNVFGRGNIPTLLDFVTKLDRCNGQGTQIVVDLIVHSQRDALDVSNIIKNIAPEPGLLDFFYKLSYAIAIQAWNDSKIHDEPGSNYRVPVPNPMKEHSYHSRREGEALCCGRQPPPPAFAPAFAPGFARAPMKMEPNN